MPRDKSAEIRVRPVKNKRPDVRALARLLIELTLADNVEPKPETAAEDPVERSA